MLSLQRRAGMRFASQTVNIQRPTTNGDSVSPCRLMGVLHELFHTQAVRWRRATDGEDASKAECRYCQLLSFRPRDFANDPLFALTANDATRSATALRHLRNGDALVYTGGDYHNARQLLQAVKRKVDGTSGRQKRRKKKRTMKEEKCILGAVVPREEWMKQLRFQQEQAELVHKILI